MTRPTVVSMTHHNTTVSLPIDSILRDRRDGEPPPSNSLTRLSALMPSATSTESLPSRLRRLRRHSVARFSLVRMAFTPRTSPSMFIPHSNAAFQPDEPTSLTACSPSRRRKRPHRRAYDNRCSGSSAGEGARSGEDVTATLVGFHHARDQLAPVSCRKPPT
jgi:hypothetical protein